MNITDRTTASDEEFRARLEGFEQGTPVAGPLSVLDQLDEAHAKATPGPWHVDEGHPHDIAVPDGGADVGYVHNPSDAALIVAAVNNLPALAAAVRAALALHVPAHNSGPTSCVECRTGQRFVPWPCPTYSTVTAALAAGGAQ